MKMRQSLIPALFLATVALSSSNVLPLSIQEPFALDGQQNDNTFSSRYRARNNLDDLFYKIYVEHQNRPLSKTLPKNSQGDDIFSIMSKNENYNGEGFRKEQWHNYPRQLDRLHKLVGYDADKRNVDPDPGNEALANDDAEDPTNDVTNEFLLESNAVFAASNPLLILKVRLASTNKEWNGNQYENVIDSGMDHGEDENEDIANENPTAEHVMKVKREGLSSAQDELTDTPSPESRLVTKRIFSFWSRLQSLNHKGHELHHRRHLHAFYSLPDSDGGGTLTAEPRAILMRPPGSPLRWG